MRAMTGHSKTEQIIWRQQIICSVSQSAGLTIPYTFMSGFFCSIAGETAFRYVYI